MQIVEGTIGRLLGHELQYQVPIYQRKYSWRKSDCEKLLSDIFKVAEDQKRKKHFIGSVIYMSHEETQNISTIDKYDLIDGQQRITTLSILLVALGDYAKEYLSAEEYQKSQYSFEALKGDYLINRYVDPEADDYLKLKLTDEDNKVYYSLISDRKLPSGIKSSLIFSNYETFLKKLRKEKKSPELVFVGIKKLTLGDVSLVPDDNAQLVFETVNSTGMRLEEIDKVRNYILMNADKSTHSRIYKDYWYPMEKNFGFDKSGRNSLSEFMKYYVAIIAKSKVPEDYYDLFKECFRGIAKESIESVVEDLYDYSNCYIKWLQVCETSKGYDRLLYNIKATGQWKVIPAVLQIMHDRDKSVLEYDDADEMLKLIESYIIRRQLCGLPSNMAGEAYVAMLGNISSVANLKKCIHNLSGKKYMPSDAELRTTLHTQKLYGQFSRIRDVLDRMEQAIDKDYTHTDKHSIEHIMPQKIQPHSELFARTDISEEKKTSLDWEADLGLDWRTIHETYCDTIGNLTLTGYNSEYQNYRFSIKCEMTDEVSGKQYGYKFTPINLSTSLKNVVIWDKSAIEKRADEMIDIIIKIWPFPELPTETITEDCEES